MQGLCIRVPAHTNARGSSSAAAAGGPLDLEHRPGGAEGLHGGEAQGLSFAPGRVHGQALRQAVDPCEALSYRLAAAEHCLPVVCPLLVKQASRVEAETATEQHVWDGAGRSGTALLP
jgi:hypothetical protein